MILLAKLILAHLIGDFLLQPKKWITEKEAQKWRSPRLLAHIAVHFLLILILTADASFWPVALLIAVLHWIIDAFKLQFQTEGRRAFWFMADQSMHLIVLVLVVLAIGELELSAIWQPDYWPYLTGLFFLTLPASSIIRHLMHKWSDSIREGENQSLQNAGNYIGMLERLFIFAAVLAGHWQPVGFLLAAKSVFRFGDLTRAHDRKLTEYILIGTLLSFGLAIAVALLVS